VNMAAVRSSRAISAAVMRTGARTSSSASRVAMPMGSATMRCAGGRFFSTPAAQLEALVSAVPKMETVAFTEVGEGLKWSYEDLKKFSDAFAGGLLETGWGPGDALAVWLPKDSPETLVIQFAAARIGLLLVEIDVGMGDAEALRSILVDNKCKGLVYDLVAGDRHNTDILTCALPELENYDDATGVPFRSRVAPDMKKLIHVGLDLVPGVANFKHMLAYDPLPALFPAEPKVSAPLSLSYGPDGAKGAAKTQKQVLDEKVWPLVSACLAKERTEF